MTKKPDNSVHNLFKSYYRDLYRFLLRKSANKEDAEDLVQETFLRVHGHQEWDSGDNPRAYLYRVADNLFIDKMRRDKCLPAQHNCVDITVLDLESGAPSLERVIQAQDQFKSLSLAIEQLTPKVKQAFVLHKLMNIPYQEIAEIMGIAVSTVEKHIAKGTAECLAWLQQSNPTVVKSEKGGKVVALPVRSKNQCGNDSPQEVNDEPK
jgi:RNA polymerase sigma factor (sigma-70 family)